MEAISFFNEALQLRGTPTHAAQDILQTLNFYFTHDTCSEESLRLEAELLVDIKEFLLHWDRVNLKAPTNNRIQKELLAEEIQVGITDMIK